MERKPEISSGHNRTVWYLFSICLLVYFFSAKGYLEVSDTAYSVQTAEAIVTRGQLDIPCAPGYTSQGLEGRCYSKYGIGLPLYYVPVVAAGRAVARITHRLAAEPVGFLLSFLNIPFALLTLLIFAELLRMFEVPEGFSSLCILALGFGTLTWRYAGYDFSEAMQMGLIVLVVYGVLRQTRGGIITSGVAFAYLFLVKQIYVLFLPVLLVYLLTHGRELRDRHQAIAWHAEARNRIHKALLFLAPFVLACAFDLWLNFVRFGNPLEAGYGAEAHRFLPSQMWHTLPMLLGSLDKGLFVYCPILAVALFGWKAFAQQHRAEAVLCGALILENLLLASAWHSWAGGWSLGPRLLVPMIPLWLLPMAFLPATWRSGRRVSVVASAVLLSVVMQIPGVLVKDQEIHHIKQNFLSPVEQASAPSDYVSAWILLRHKLVFGNEVYRVTEFHVPGNRELNLDRYRTFVGFDLWTEQTARYLNKPALRWLPLPFLLVIVLMASQIAMTLIIPSSAVTAGAEERLRVRLPS